MTREEKIRSDGETLEKYKEQLQNTAKAYMQTFSAFSVNQRKSRAAAAGECVLKALDEVKGLIKTKPMKAGTLDFIINEVKVKDPDGKKGWRYEISYRMVSYERKYTDEEIKKELEETAAKLKAETEEMFPEEERNDGNE